MSMVSRVRLHVGHPLGAGQCVPLARDQAHYLFSVMRLARGDMLALFNGRDGEWRAEVAESGKRAGILRCVEQTRPQSLPPDLWLLFAPIKKARTDFIVEKAAEMGARRILPVHTDFTNAGRVRRDRLQVHAVEAAEQCGGVFVPEVDEFAALDRVLSDWPEGRHLIWCDEGRAGEAADFAAGLVRGAPGAVLIGPEGGFSAAERARIDAFPQARVMNLGPRILRADTAAVAALTCWQRDLGDWQ